MSQHAYIAITRVRSVSYVLRGYSVIVDDKTIDKLKSGETKKYALPPGSHRVRVSIDYFKSEELGVRLEAGETLELVCGDAGPKTVGQSFSLKSVGTSLKALVHPSDYLYLRPATDAPAVGRPPPVIDVPPRDEKPRAPRRRAKRTIFVSYRREDSRAITGRISDRLTQHFGTHAVFRDVDSIPIGVDFRDRIRETIEKSDVLICIIGPGWLNARDEDDSRRLDKEEDFVRLEIEAALAQEIAVVPVLVDAAEMPAADELPESLAPLAYRNALFIPREPFFHAGVDKLVEEIEALGRGGDPGAAANRFCVGCGKPLSGQKFCTGCGRPAQPKR